MSFNVLATKQKLTKHYVNSVITHFHQAEQVIMQNDRSAMVEEKIISIAASLIFMWVLGLAISFTGAGLVLFLIGWCLSRTINSKVYGKPRDKSKLNEQEASLIEDMTAYTKRLKPLKLKASLSAQRKQVLFLDYPKYLTELDAFLTRLEQLDVSHLTIKYRTAYARLLKAHQALLFQLTRAFEIN
jgi:hypothetical protein